VICFIWALFLYLAMVYHFYELCWTLLVAIIIVVCSLTTIIYMVLIFYELFCVHLSLTLFLKCSGKTVLFVYVCTIFFDRNKSAVFIMKVC
jgi:hypothetical protein